MPPYPSTHSCDVGLVPRKYLVISQQCFLTNPNSTLPSLQTHLPRRISVSLPFRYFCMECVGPARGWCSHGCICVSGYVSAGTLVWYFLCVCASVYVPYIPTAPKRLSLLFWFFLCNWIIIWFHGWLGSIWISDILHLLRMVCALPYHSNPTGRTAWWCWVGHWRLSLVGLSLSESGIQCHLHSSEPH